MNWVILNILMGFFFITTSDAKQPPHIIVILADDLGWNDVSFHGSNQIPTPNIDALAYNGIILNNHHVQPLCTPSRSAFLTGKYPIHTGMQHHVLKQPEPRGLPLEETLLPQHLKKLGYSNHIVGKWHLGFFRSEYTPTRRGFDSHYGYWNSFQDYYDHKVFDVRPPGMIGYDMRRNMDVDRTAEGKYSTDLFSKEAVDIISVHNTSVPMYLHLAHLAVHVANSYNLLQAPEKEVSKFSHIADPKRRIYAAMVSLLDKSVGDLMTALKNRGMMDNSIILFMADNGAEEEGNYPNHGSNYPLRGQKDSPWEGGSRGVAAIWSPLFNKVNSVSNELIHISDWLPTFWSAAGGDIAELGKIDGINMWNTLRDNSPSKRTEYVLNIDPLTPYVAIRRGQWKYINGSTWNGKHDVHFQKPDKEHSISYNISDVLSSPTAAVFEAYYSDQKNNNLNKLADVPKTLTEEDIIALREDAIINCNNKENTVGFLCDPLKSPCLFDIDDDPCEYVNLATVNKTALESMQDLVKQYEETSVPPSNKPTDPLANPKYYGDVWSCWKDDDVVITV